MPELDNTWQPMPVQHAVAPIDVTALWGAQVDPQRAPFRAHHLAATIVAMVQSLAIMWVLYRVPQRSYVRTQVIHYGLLTSVFILTYGFTGHTWASNILAVGHNHTEIQLIAIALFNKKYWPLFLKLSYIYWAGYACWSCMVSVKTGRRAWTLVGYIWDGMFPLAFLVRYWRTKRDKKFLFGFVAAVIHLLSITQLLTMVDGVAQWFALLMPPTYICLAVFAFRWEKVAMSQLPGLHGMDKTSDGELPLRAFWPLYALVWLVLGLPLGGILYLPRIIAPLLA